MAKIITVTFNPTIDKSTTISALIPEKKLRCSQPYFEPGGGGLNVSKSNKKTRRRGPCHLSGWRIFRQIFN